MVLAAKDGDVRGLRVEVSGRPVISDLVGVAGDGLAGVRLVEECQASVVDEFETLGDLRREVVGVGGGRGGEE